MKNIKYRAWDKITKQIFEVTEINFNAIERNVYGWITYKELLGKVEESLSFRSFDDAEIMQYTGLKDKHGKEIYEGDIVKFWVDGYAKSRTAKVKFNTERGRWMLFATIGHHRDLTAERASKCEIIGNIYEDKESY